MISTAVICEFNPIHIGHKYVLRCAREHIGDENCVIAVMSGNFSERCTPAVYDKYTRAASAVIEGADLVLELPFPFSCCGAENFARGGVAVAKALGVSSLTFGSESGEVEGIMRAAEIKATREFAQRQITLEREHRELGSAAVFAMTVAEFGLDPKMGANDKLGMEYIRFAREAGICEFNVVKRDFGFRSAGEIRRDMFLSSIKAAQSDISPEVLKLFADKRILSEEKFAEILFLYARLGLDVTENEVLLVARKKAEEARCAEDFYLSLATKKYTAARVRRELLFSLLRITENELNELVQIPLVLAANARGREYLAENRKRFEYPPSTRPSEALSDANVRADRLYATLADDEAGAFLRRSPMIFK